MRRLVALLLLLGPCVALPVSGAQAIAASGRPAASPPRATATATSLLGVSVRHATSIGVSLPNAVVSLPGVGVPLPGVKVSLPSVGVSLPGVSVSTPAVSVSTPEVTVSPPSPPSASPPSTTSTETPTTGSAPTGPAGGETGTSPSWPPSSTGSDPGSSDVAVAASVSTAAHTSSPVSPAAGAQLPSAGGGRRSPPTVRRSARVRRRRRPGSRASTVGLAASHATAPISFPVKASRAPGSGSHVRATRRGASSGNPLEAIGRHIPLPLPVPDWSKPIILALLLLATWFGVRSYLASRRARRLEGQRVGLLADMGVMQAALVPEVPGSLGGLSVSVAYRPAEGPAAGGDFYDLFVPAPGKVAIILGDVAGHGHEALNQAALTRYTLRAYIQAGLQPRAALGLAGRVLADPEGERYATVAVGVYDRRGSRLTYALAGHPPPILRGFEACEPLTICSSPPLGCGIPTGRRQSTVSLPTGAAVCFFSDGLIEARCAESEEGRAAGDDGLLGRERLSEILAALGPRPAAEDLLAGVRAAAEATPDDMAACILAPQAPAGGAGAQVEELEVDQRALAQGQVRRFLDACRLPAPEVARAIELASEIAIARDTAVLRIERSSTAAAVTVSLPRVGASHVTSRGEWPLAAVEEPLLAHALIGP